MKSEGLTFVKMQRGRWFSSEEALRLILNNTAEDSLAVVKMMSNISSLLKRKCRMSAKSKRSRIMVISIFVVKVF